MLCEVTNLNQQCEVSHQSKSKLLANVSNAKCKAPPPLPGVIGVECYPVSQLRITRRELRSEGMKVDGLMQLKRHFRAE